MAVVSVDCRFNVDNNRFQLRVGAIIIEEGCVLLAKNDAADYYYSVGGGVKLLETACEAVKREVFEETGLAYEVDRLVFVQENFFEDIVVAKGVTFHEVCLHFLMKPRGRKEAITQESECATGVEHMHWIPLEKLHSIKVFPVFYPEKLLNLPENTEHIITNELKV